jgi:hypothetical protein
MKHNPSKVPKVARILKACTGRHGKLRKALKDKYGEDIHMFDKTSARAVNNVPPPPRLAPPPAEQLPPPPPLLSPPTPSSQSSYKGDKDGNGRKENFGGDLVAYWASSPPPKEVVEEDVRYRLMTPPPAKTPPAAPDLPTPTALPPAPPDPPSFTATAVKEIEDSLRHANHKQFAGQLSLVLVENHRLKKHNQQLLQGMQEMARKLKEAEAYGAKMAQYALSLKEITGADENMRSKLL